MRIGHMYSTRSTGIALNDDFNKRRNDSAEEDRSYSQRSNLPVVSSARKSPGLLSHSLPVVSSVHKSPELIKTRKEGNGGNMPVVSSTHKSPGLLSRNLPVASSAQEPGADAFLPEQDIFFIHDQSLGKIKEIMKKGKKFQRTSSTSFIRHHQWMM